MCAAVYAVDLVAEHNQIVFLIADGQNRSEIERAQIQLQESRPRAG